MGTTMRATDIAGGAPAWVYVLLVVLIVLGVRRIRTREVPVIVALIPAAAFLIWSIAGVLAFARIGGAPVAIASWLVGAAFGVLTALAVPEPPGERQPGGRVRIPGSWLPLILYIGVFVARFACGAWAAIVPAQVLLATGIGIAIGAGMTARLIVAVARRRPAPPATLA